MAWGWETERGGRGGTGERIKVTVRGEEKRKRGDGETGGRKIREKRYWKTRRGREKREEW